MTQRNKSFSYVVFGGKLGGGVREDVDHQSEMTSWIIVQWENDRKE
jgi:hypothetical protein